MIEFKHCEFCQSQSTLFLDNFCFKCQPPSPGDIYEIFAREVAHFYQKAQKLESELATERETTQQALTTSQE
jgi:hypothetical protein